MALAVAGPAISLPVVDVRVLLAVLVPARTGRLDAVADSSVGVHLRRDGIEVGRVAARRVPAQVVDHQPAWNRAVEEFIRPPVSKDPALDVSSDAPVSVAGPGCHPEPAAGFLLLDVREEQPRIDPERSRVFDVSAGTHDW
jgi:hypothetical protein